MHMSHERWAFGSEGTRLGGDKRGHQQETAAFVWVPSKKTPIPAALTKVRGQWTKQTKRICGKSAKGSFWGRGNEQGLVQFPQSNEPTSTLEGSKNPGVQHLVPSSILSQAFPRPVGPVKGKGGGKSWARRPRASLGAQGRAVIRIDGGLRSQVGMGQNKTIRGPQIFQSLVPFSGVPFWVPFGTHCQVNSATR